MAPPAHLKGALVDKYAQISLYEVPISELAPGLTIPEPRELTHAPISALRQVDLRLKLLQVDVQRQLDEHLTETFFGRWRCRGGAR